MFYLKMHMNVVCVCTCICVHSLHGQNKEFCSVLKDIVLEPKTYIHMFHENWRDEKSEGVELLTGKSQDDGHVHRVVISAREVDMLKEGRSVLVETGETNGHSHEMTIRRWKNGIYVMIGCDAAKYCFDRHDIHLPVAPAETGDGGSDELM